MTLHASIRERLPGQLGTPAIDQAAQLNEALRLLSKWRSGPTPWVVMKAKSAGARP